MNYCIVCMKQLESNEEVCRECMPKLYEQINKVKQLVEEITNGKREEAQKEVCS